MSEAFDINEIRGDSSGTHGDSWKETVDAIRARILAGSSRKEARHASQEAGPNLEEGLQSRYASEPSPALEGAYQRLREIEAAIARGFRDIDLHPEKYKNPETSRINILHQYAESWKEEVADLFLYGRFLDLKK